MWGAKYSAFARGFGARRVDVTSCPPMALRWDRAEAPGGNIARLRTHHARRRPEHRLFDSKRGVRPTCRPQRGLRRGAFQSQCNSKQGGWLSALAPIEDGEETAEVRIVYILTRTVRLGRSTQVCSDRMSECSAPFGGVKAGARSQEPGARAVRFSKIIAGGTCPSGGSLCCLPGCRRIGPRPLGPHN
jgi:hypothetical protein